MEQVKVLFVCMGNICRSPTAEGVFRYVVETDGKADLISIDSAGTHAYHVGEQPDPRAQVTATARGVDLSSQKARRVAEQDFYTFNYILAMDNDNLSILNTMRPADSIATPELFLSYANNSHHREVPDPYYGGTKGFDKVFDMVEAASDGLLRHIKENDLKQ